MAIADKQQATAEVEEQRAAGAGERLAPAAGLNVRDMFNWLTNEIHALRGEIKDLRGEIKDLRDEGNRRYESLQGQIKELNEKFHSLQKQTWFLGMLLAVAFFASGNPENPILNWVFTVLGSR